MAEPMRVSPVPPETMSPPSRAEIASRARALRRKLGRPLRMEIDGPLTDEELAEVVLARAKDNGRVPIEDILDEFRADNSGRG